MRAFVFPGQGTQRTGMGERFANLSPAAHERYVRAGELLGRDVAALCFRAPPEVLRDTRNAQVAVVVTNLAALELVRSVGCRADVVAGHSVGELSALVAAGCLSADDAVRTVDVRAGLMGGVRARGSMASVRGLDVDRVEAICREVAPGQVVVAVVNDERDVVVSGPDALVRAVERGARDGGARVAGLEVSHAFHSPSMAEVRVPWEAHVSSLTLHPLDLPVVLNVTGEATTDLSVVRQALIDQVTAPVRWWQSLDTMRALGVDDVLEVGHSRFLSGLARRSIGVSAASLIEPRAVHDLMEGAVR